MREAPTWSCCGANGAITLLAGAARLVALVLSRGVAANAPPQSTRMAPAIHISRNIRHIFASCLFRTEHRYSRTALPLEYVAIRRYPRPEKRSIDALSIIRVATYQQP